MTLHVVFTEVGIPGWIGTEPREGSEEVDKDIGFLVAHRRTPKGNWVRRAPVQAVEPTAEELAEQAAIARETAMLARDEALREALAREADPLFFKWQAGEVTEADWREARSAVKARFPKPDGG